MPRRQKEQREDKVNRYIRQRIHAARTERGMSQEQLARYLEKSRVTVSDLERGRVRVGAADLAIIAGALEKPIDFFYPPAARGVEKDDLSPAEQELVLQASYLSEDDLRKLVAQARALAELSIEEDMSPR
jgi:transcriptional regulator with XRE-family HTH domain